MKNIKKLLNFNIKEKINLIEEIFILYYGEEYRSYITESLKKLIFIPYINSKKFDLYYQKRELLKNENLKKRLEGYSIKKKFIKMINKKQIGFNENVLKNNNVGMIPNIANNELITTIYFPILGIKKERLDLVLIHEVLHVIEEHIIENSESNVILGGGFEKWVLKGKDENNREFEFFNELIHHEISKEITDLMHSKNLYLFLEKKDSKEKCCEDCSLVIKEFYYSFKEPLIRSKLVGDIDKFEGIVGKKELGCLAKWCVEFYNEYQTPKERKELERLKNKKYLNKIEEGLNIVNEMKRKQNIIKKMIY
ncbi:MAG: hypothetical protein ACOXZR_01770 [Bacilli bacterium]|jgi:hypothetical protein